MTDELDLILLEQSLSSSYSFSSEATIVSLIPDEGYSNED